MSIFDTALSRTDSSIRLEIGPAYGRLLTVIFMRSQVWIMTKSYATRSNWKGKREDFGAFANAGFLPNRL